MENRIMRYPGRTRDQQCDTPIGGGIDHPRIGIVATIRMTTAAMIGTVVSVMNLWRITYSFHPYQWW